MAKRQGRGSRRRYDDRAALAGWLGKEYADAEARSAHSDHREDGITAIGRLVTSPNIVSLTDQLGSIADSLRITTHLGKAPSLRYTSDAGSWKSNSILVAVRNTVEYEDLRDYCENHVTGFGPITTSRRDETATVNLTLMDQSFDPRLFAERALVRTTGDEPGSRYDRQVRVQLFRVAGPQTMEFMTLTNELRHSIPETAVQLGPLDLINAAPLTPS
jgi:hypothetical protein